MIPRIPRRHKHYLMAAGLAAVAFVEGTMTAWATVFINLVWLMEE